MDKPKHRNTVEFQVSGSYALFTDVLTRTGGERCTYMIPTYEALKGILQSTYWKPTLVWIIDSVRIMNPIRTVRKGIRPIKYSGGNDLAYYTYLEDVCYQVRAHFEWNLNRPELKHDRLEHKHHNIARRMIERGGRRDIYLGTRECQGYVEPCVFGEGKGAYDGTGTIPYSLVYHGITYADEAENPEDMGQMTAVMTAAIPSMPVSARTRRSRRSARARIPTGMLLQRQPVRNGSTCAASDRYSHSRGMPFLSVSVAL